MTGSPPMPTQVDWPMPGVGHRLDRLVGERAGPGHHADVVPRDGLTPGMIPTLAWPGDVAPGQFGPMSRAPARRTASTTGTMSSAGMPSVMQKMVEMPAPTASRTASGAPPAGTKMQDVLAPVSRTASAMVSNTGTEPSSAVWPPLSGRHAGHDRGAVGLHGTGMELALTSGDALDHEPRVAPDEDAHRLPSPADAATAFAAASSSEVAVSNFAAWSSSAASAAFVPTMRTTIGTARVCWARASISPRATSSPRVIPPKMLTRMALTFGSLEDQAHRRRDLVRLGAAADVEEVGGLAAGALDQVHRGHGQTGAVDHAADRAVELDEA